MPYADPKAQAAAGRRHYEKNKDAAKARARAHTARQRALLRRISWLIREATPCADCGGNFPAVAMDFDHVRGEKIDSVANLIGKGCVSVEKLFEEIRKCEVVCANCHRVRTATRAILADSRVEQVVSSSGS